MTVSDLKQVGKQEGFKLNGTKPELISRLLENHYSRAVEISKGANILKCSQSARDFLDQYEKEKNTAMQLAKEQSFEALIKGKTKEAYKIFTLYHRKYSEHNNVNSWYFDKINSIIKSSPKVLSSIKKSDLDSLRAAVCMGELWADESAEAWLPDTFVSTLKNNQIAINYLKVNAEIYREVYDDDDYYYYYYYYDRKFKLVFDECDIDSCSLCLQLKDKVFDKKSFPDLPMENCTSEKGCQCTVYEVFDNDSDEENEVHKTDPTFNVFLKIKNLKDMLDQKLITNEHYEKSVADLLANYSQIK